MAHYRIKEAAKQVGVLPHVLRFWETQFPSLKPNKTGKGQRLYSDEDLTQFKKVKHLLYTEGYSIQGAKKALREKKTSVSTTSAMEKEFCREVFKELTELRNFALRF